MCLVHIPLQAYERQRRFTLGWNGSRFAACRDLERLAKTAPDAPEVLRLFLSRTVRPPGARKAIRAVPSAGSASAAR
jgi:hypothetical protein